MVGKITIWANDIWDNDIWTINNWVKDVVPFQYITHCKMTCNNLQKTKNAVI